MYSVRTAGSGCDLIEHFIRGINIFHTLVQGVLRGGNTGIQVGGALLDVADADIYRADKTLDLTRKIFDLLGNDRKAFSLLSGAGGFNRSIQGKHVCLVGNRDDLCHAVLDLLNGNLEIGKGVLHFQKALLHFFGAVFQSVNTLLCKTDRAGNVRFDGSKFTGSPVHIAEQLMKGIQLFAECGIFVQNELECLCDGLQFI